MGGAQVKLRGRCSVARGCLRRVVSHAAPRLCRWSGLSLSAQPARCRPSYAVRSRARGSRPALRRVVSHARGLLELGAGEASSARAYIEPVRARSTLRKLARAVDYVSRERSRRRRLPRCHGRIRLVAICGNRRRRCSGSKRYRRRCASGARARQARGGGRSSPSKAARCVVFPMSLRVAGASRASLCPSSRRRVDRESAQARRAPRLKVSPAVLELEAGREGHAVG